jgi:hypothetical protein
VIFSLTLLHVKQAEAELSQAQEKLGLAKPALPSKKAKGIPLTLTVISLQLRPSSISHQ